MPKDVRDLVRKESLLNLSLKILLPNLATKVPSVNFVMVMVGAVELGVKPSRVKVP